MSAHTFSRFRQFRSAAAFLVVTLVLAGSFALQLGHKVGGEPQPDDFEGWLAGREKGQVLDEADITKGVELAKARRAELAELILKDPRAALKRAIPYSQRETLPKEILAQLEDRIEGLGSFSLTCACSTKNKAGLHLGHREEKTLTLNGKTYKASVFGIREALSSKNELPVSGIAIDNVAAIEEDALSEISENVIQKDGNNFEDLSSSDLSIPGTPFFGRMAGKNYKFASRAQFDAARTQIRALEQKLDPNPSVNIIQALKQKVDVAAVRSAHTLGAKKVFFTFLDFPDKEGRPIDSDPKKNVPMTVAYCQPVIDQAVSYYNTVSFGKTQIVPTLVDKIYRMPQTSKFYEENGNFFPDAMKVAGVDNVLADYDRLVFITSALDGKEIDYRGVAQSGRLIHMNGNFFFPTLTHEIGHTYGLPHANNWEVPDNNPISPKGYSNQYGDSYDMMSNNDDRAAGHHFNPYYKLQMEWIPQASVQKVTGSGTYRLKRCDGATNDGTLALRIVRDATFDYLIYLRRAINVTEVKTGAMVAWVPRNFGSENLIETTQPRVGGDEPLQPQRSLVDPVAHVTIKPLANGGTAPDEYMDIELTFEDGVTVTTAKSVSVRDLPNQQLPVSAQITANGANIDGGTVTFRVYETNSKKVVGPDVTSGPVVTGQASATVNLGKVSIGTEYSILAKYTPAAGFLASEDLGTLTVNANAGAKTTVSAQNLTLPYSPAARSLALTANVKAANNVTVNEGLVTFSLSYVDPVAADIVAVGTSVEGKVVNGVASVQYPVGPALPEREYSVDLSFSGGATTNPSTDGNSTVTIKAIATSPTATMADNYTTQFSANEQLVPLSAKVVVTKNNGNDQGFANGVNEGTFTFQVLNGNTPVGNPVTATVVNGKATALYALPAGLAAQDYKINVKFTGGGLTEDSTDNGKTLTIQGAAASATTTAAQPATAAFGVASVPLNATVTITNGNTPATEGTVSFQITDNAGGNLGNAVNSATVANGQANVNYTLPVGIAAGSYKIVATFSGGTATQTSSDNSKNLVITAAAVNTSTTVAKAVRTGPSAREQDVVLRATVTSNGQPVNEGTVKFEVNDNGTTIGTPRFSSAVINGVTSVLYTLPPALPAKDYTIVASFSGGITTQASSDSTQKLTVDAAIVNPGRTTGTIKTLVIRIDFPDKPGLTDDVLRGQDITVPFAQAQMQIVANYITASSYGNAKLDSTISAKIYRAPKNGVFYQDSPGGFEQFIDDAKKLASADYQLDTFDKLIFCNAGLDKPNFDFNGVVSKLGDKEVEVNGTMEFLTVAHELLHGLGLQHSDSWVVPDGNAISANGRDLDYGDRFDIMGSPPKRDDKWDINPWYKQRLNWIPDSAVRVVTGPGTYRINRCDGDKNDGILALKIRKDANRDYWVCIRRKPDAATYPLVTSGTVVFWGGPNNDFASMLLDLNTPSGEIASNDDAPLALNQTFTDPALNLTIKPLVNGGTPGNEFVDVQITLPATPTVTNAMSATVAFNAAQQTETLSAVVTANGAPVNEGTVTFQIKDGTNNVGTAVVSGPVTNGKATAVYTIPAGQAAGTQYLINASFSGGNSTQASSDNAKAFVITPPAAVDTVTVADPAELKYSDAPQNASLKATVTANNNPVTEGKVSFVVKDGTTTVGTPVESAVTGNGTVSILYPIPAAQVGGKYNIEASFSGGPNTKESSDTAKFLTIIGSRASDSVTTAMNKTAPFSAGTQSVTLEATVIRSGFVEGGQIAKLNEGDVTFQLKSGANPVGTAVTSATVADNKASVSYALPAGLAAGVYTIEATYSGGPTAKASSDKAKELTISGPAVTVTAADPATAPFSQAAQFVALKATVKDANNAPVTEGEVTFSIFDGTTLIETALDGTVTNGVATANYKLTAGLKAQEYKIEAKFSGGAATQASADTSMKLLVTPPALVATTTEAFNRSTPFNAASQDIQLDVTVTAANPVNEGDVTFEIRSGNNTVIGNAVTTKTLVAGKGSATYTVPAGQDIGTYTIVANFSGGATTQASSDNGKTLNITPAATTTAAVDTPATFDAAAQSVQLNSMVTSAGLAAAVNEGTVTFVVKTGAGAVIGTPATSATVAAGAASVNYILPAGLAADVYNIEATFSGGANTGGSSDTTRKLTVAAPKLDVTTTLADNASITYNATAQTVKLSATVTGAAPVNEGSVTFTVKKGTTVIGAPTKSATVVNGAASVTFDVPAGQPADSYNIEAAFSGGAATAASNDVKALAITPAPSITQALDAPKAFSTKAQDVTLSATISANGDPVNEGTVTFTIRNGTTVIPPVLTSATVNAGFATVTFPLDPGFAAGLYIIEAVYNGSANIQPSSDKSKRLSIALDETTTTAVNTPADFSQAAQTVKLVARVDTLGAQGVVNEGTVKFQVKKDTTLIGTAVTSAQVANGDASVQYALPAGLAADTYTIEASFSGGQTTQASADNNAKLTINPAVQIATTTTADDVPATFSAAPQDVTLSATVTANGAGVNEGTVTFTVNGGAEVKSGVLNNGKATATYSLPAALAAGNYKITAVFSGGTTTLGSSDNSKNVTIAQAATTIVAENKPAPFDATAQNVELKATVTTGPNSTPVTDGNVTFLVKDGATEIGTATPSGALVNGVATVNYVVPGGTPPKSYMIVATYSGGPNTQASTDSTRSLTIQAANLAATVTTGQLKTTRYNPLAQVVPLEANVTAGGNPVDEGRVTFQIKDGQTNIGTAVTSDTVANGKATVNYTVPAGLPFKTGGNYKIEATFNPGPNTAGSSDNTAIFGILQEATTTTVDAPPLTFSQSAQNATLNATVTFASGKANEGVVVFQIKDGKLNIGNSVTSATLVDGKASVSYPLPAGLAPQSYDITATFTNAVNLSDSKDETQSLIVAKAASTTVADAKPIPYDDAAQQVTLNATVTSAAGIADGAVTFTLKNGQTVIAGPVVSQTLGANGLASATLTLPAMLTPGTYAIEASYSGGVNVLGSSDNAKLLTVLAPVVQPTVTQAENAGAGFSAFAQNVTLSATITANAAGVDEGTVTFKVLKGTTLIGAPVTSAKVNKGRATALFSLPGGTPVDVYTIEATFSGGLVTQSSSDSSKFLTVSAVAPAVVATQTTADIATAPFNAASVILTAKVLANGAGVNEGTVTFQVKNGVNNVGAATVSPTVAAGTATVTYALPPGETVKICDIVATFSGGATTQPSSDNTQKLSITQAPVTVAANNAPATFDVSAQNVPLGALVQANGVNANEGTVTFQIKDANNINVGTAVTSATVANGNATATYVLPGGTAAGTYTIVATFNGGPNTQIGSDNAHTLTVSPANLAATTLTTNNLNVIYTPGAQTVRLGANVTTANPPVGEGTVTFQLKKGNANVGTAKTSATVQGGTAEVLYDLPAGASGSFVIEGTYSGSQTFQTSFSNAGLLTIDPAPTTTKASDAPKSFKPTTQDVLLSAQVKSGGVGVNEGTVTFTVRNGKQIVGTPTTSATVNAGIANVNYTLPAALATGVYDIEALFSGGPNTIKSGDNTASLSIILDSTTTTADSLITPFSVVAKNVTLSATVDSIGGQVNEGTVAFTVKDGTTVIGTPVVSNVVTAGKATVAYPLPAALPAKTYTIEALFSGGQSTQPSSDKGKQLTVMDPIVTATTIEADNVTTSFNPSARSVTLTAVVKAGGVGVDEGTVTFQVKDAATNIGAAVISSRVSAGKASVAYALDAAQAVKSYTIVATFNPGLTTLGSNDNAHTLQITGRQSVTSAVKAMATFSNSAQNVILNASVTANGAFVNEGTITFVVKDGQTVVGAPTTSGIVTNGDANVTYALPAALPAKSYTIVATFSGGLTTQGSSDSSRPLIITPVNLIPSTTSTFDEASQFSISTMNVIFKASVATNAAPLNEGTVTFQLMDGLTNVGTAVTSPALVLGNTTAVYTLPAGLAAKTYTIQATFNGSSTAAGSSAIKSLVVGKSGTTTVVTNATTSFNPAVQTVPLSAVVSTTGGFVGEGTVTFQVKDGANNIGTAVTSATLQNGSATVNYPLPAGLAVKVYDIVATFSGSANTLTSTDSTKKLSLNQSASVTTASNATAPFNAGPQNIALNATVTANGAPINEGTVTFQLTDGANNIGTAVISATVANGAASVTYALPASLPAKIYTINASFSGSASAQASSDTSKTLTLGTASVTTGANASAPFSATTQNVTLTATVSAGGVASKEGNVTFQLKDGATNVGTAVTSATLTNGTATVSYALPAGLAPKDYTINAVYSGGLMSLGSSDATKVLTITSDSITTAATATATFSTAAQNVTLSATVSSASQPAKEGTVTFQIKNGVVNIGSAVTSPALTNGTASVVYVLPAGLAVNTYAIVATYSGGSKTSASSDSTKLLTIAATPSSTVAAAASVPFSASAQNVTLSAAVASAGAPVTEGTVSFQIKDGATNIGTSVTSTALTNGTATVSYALPAGLAAKDYSIVASFSGGVTVAASSDTTKLLTVTADTVTTASNAAAPFRTDVQNVTLKASVATAAGAVTEGTVTFQVLDGVQNIGTAVKSAPLTNGTTSVSYALPAGLALKDYTISATYSGGAKTSGSSDKTKKLSVVANAEFTSGPTATPPVASVGQDVNFLVVAKGSGVLKYLWDFADGTASTDAAPTHAFNAAGTYVVKLTVTDDFNSISSNVTVVVTEVIYGLGVDSDHDGFSDSLEILYKTNPLDPQDVPVGVPLNPPPPLPLKLASLTFKVNFSKPNGDTLSMSGFLPIPAGTKLAGQKIYFETLGFPNLFVLGAGGKSAPGVETFTFGKPAGGGAKFAIKYSKVNLVKTMKLLGIDENTPSGKIDLPVTILFNGAGYKVTRTVLFKKSGMGASAK